jgi:hypothetical protein
MAVALQHPAKHQSAGVEIVDNQNTTVRRLGRPDVSGLVRHAAVTFERELQKSNLSPS